MKEPLILVFVVLLAVHLIAFTTNIALLHSSQRFAGSQHPTSSSSALRNALMQRDESVIGAPIGQAQENASEIEMGTSTIVQQPILPQGYQMRFRNITYRARLRHELRQAERQYRIKIGTDIPNADGPRSIENGIQPDSIESIMLRRKPVQTAARRRQNVTRYILRSQSILLYAHRKSKVNILAIENPDNAGQTQSPQPKQVVAEAKQSVAYPRPNAVPRRPLPQSGPRLWYSSFYIDQARTWHSLTTNAFGPDRPVVSIRGAMSTGTNWLRALFKTNCRGIPFEVNTTTFGDIAFQQSGKFLTRMDFDADGLFGWKHGLLHEAELNQLREHPNRSIVVMTRNAVEWALSLFRMANKGMIPKLAKSGDIGQFMRLHYSHKCPDDYPGTPIIRYYVATSNLSLVPEDSFKLPFSYSNCAQYSQQAASVIDARTRDYKNWLHALGINPGQIKLIRYESLRDRPYEVFSQLVDSLPGANGKLFRDFCTFNETTFDKVSTYAKFGRNGGAAGKTLRNIPNANKSTNEDFRKFDHDELCKKFYRGENGTTSYRFLLQNLDTEFERVSLGYEYPTNVIANVTSCEELKPPLPPMPVRPIVRPMARSYPMKPPDSGNNKTAQALRIVEKATIL